MSAGAAVLPESLLPGEPGCASLCAGALADRGICSSPRTSQMKRQKMVLGLNTTGHLVGKKQNYCMV